MRLPMLSRTISRSHSGLDYYDSRSGSSEEESTLQSAGESAQQRIARRKQKRKRKRSSKIERSPLVRSLSIFLMAGLLFCLLDVLYILNFVQRDNHSIHGNNRSLQPPILPAAASDVDTKTRPIQQLDSDWPEAETGKEPILRLLKEATGTDTVDPETEQRIPEAKDVAAMYGRAPVVLGLETCQQFQQMGDPAEHFVSTAGSFNTGTNLMAELLIANCHMPARMKKYGKSSRGVRWQVLWGKHTPVFDEEFRQNHRTYSDPTLTANNMFPAVTVRDPFKWAQSMCRHSYGAKWPHDNAHCPNLVPNDVDRELLKKKNQTLANHKAVNVTVEYAAFDQHHDSLLGFWNDWYRDYVKAPFPRLIVRFEDVVFHPKIVTQTVCECAGGEMNTHKPFKYIVDSAKKGAAHGAEKTSYVDALVKYGTEAGRYRGFEAADIEYAKQHLDPDLMRLFGYRYPSAEVNTSTTINT